MSKAKSGTRTGTRSEATSGMLLVMLEGAKMILLPCKFLTLASNLSDLQYARYSANWLGHPVQRLGMVVDCFFSIMSLYFLLALLALSPCHGSPPLRK